MAGSVICIANWKGGCGKSTLCTVLAVNLAAEGYRVSVIDSDPNQAFATWFRTAEAPPLTCLSCIDHNEIVARAYAEAEKHDVVLVDTAGFANQAAVFGIGAADLVLIPVMPDRNSVIEARKTAKQVESVGQIARRTIPHRVVLSRWTPKGLSERATIADLSEAKLPMLQHPIPNLTAFQKASFSGEMPYKGYIGFIASRLIEELRGIGAIPTKGTGEKKLGRVQKEAAA
jgi:chromosome partitioning protein